jgi:GTP-binding protein
VADIPGLIEGASEGKGLGDEFLRHVERTKVLIHLIDAWSEDVSKAYSTIMTELGAYKIDLTHKPQIIALSKIDGLDDEIIADQLGKLKKAAPKDSQLFAISAPSRAGTKELLYAVLELVRKSRVAVQEASDAKLPIIGIKEDDKAWHIAKEGDDFYVRGRKIERFAIRADVDTEEGERRVRDIMRKMGIMSALERQGIVPDQKIHIGSICTIEY